MKKLSLILAGLGMLVLFQNCDTSQPSSDPDSLGDILSRIGIDPTVGSSDESDEVVLNANNEFSKVRLNSIEVYYDEATNTYVTPYIEADLDAGKVMFHVVSGAAVECDLSEDRAIELENQMLGVDICESPPPPPGTVQCLAASVPDLFLSDTSGSETAVGSPICGDGQWLCNGGNDNIKAILHAIVNEDDLLGCRNL